MKATCKTCGDPIVSSGDDQQWFHFPIPDDVFHATLHQHRKVPVPHVAEPAEESARS